MKFFELSFWRSILVGIAMAIVAFVLVILFLGAIIGAWFSTFYLLKL